MNGKDTVRFAGSDHFRQCHALEGAWAAVLEVMLDQRDRELGPKKEEG